ncbi:MAG: DUF420 domain-containing protein [Natronomonas sp.]
MSTVRGPAFARDHPRLLALVLTLVGYVVVIGTLYVGLPIYPTISERTVDLLSHGIALVNSLTIVSLSLGWYWIRTDQVRKHRAAMILGFILILVFLVLYLLKTGGGGRKDILAGAPLRSAYLGMLAIHIILSIVSVPLVLYAITLGLTHTPSELRSTPHATVGRIAVSAWIVSLVLGIVTYVLLTYYYGPEQIEFVRMTVGPAVSLS